jgi:hypothetical protein
MKPKKIKFVERVVDTPDGVEFKSIPVTRRRKALSILGEIFRWFLGVTFILIPWIVGTLALLAEWKVPFAISILQFLTTLVRKLPPL